MTKHTPGPWKLQDLQHAFAVCTDGGHTIADVFGMSSPENGIETDANACLIATAPDLLRALIDARNLIAVSAHFHGAQDQSDASAIMADMESVIAKATGAA